MQSRGAFFGATANKNHIAIMRGYLWRTRKHESDCNPGDDDDVVGLEKGTCTNFLDPVSYVFRQAADPDYDVDVMVPSCKYCGLSM